MNVPSKGEKMGEMEDGERRKNEHAIVIIDAMCVGAPCFKTSVTVSTVPVDGDHVMLNGCPAVMDVSAVKEKGFCALTMVANTRKKAGRRLVRFILAASNPFGVRFASSRRRF